TGFGPTIKVAKQEALSDLSQSIKAEVQSSFSNSKTQYGDAISKTAKSNIVVSSNLPIIGAEFELFDNPESVEALVALSPKKAKTLYQTKLTQLHKEIKTLKQKIDTSKQSHIKVELLTRLLQNLNEFDRYYSVGIIIGLKDIALPRVSKAYVHSALLELQNHIDSLQQAGRHLAKAFKDYDNIYLYPPKADGSHEITPFAKALTLQIKPHIKNAPNLAKAKYQLIGHYIYNDKGLIVNYDLIDIKTHENKYSSTISLKPQAYKDYRITSNTLNFDQLLHNGVVSSSSLKASVVTNKGSDELLFIEAEEVELLIKLNKMGYYYLVGYTQTEAGKFAYLLELNEAAGEQRFKGFINADDANRWMSLGIFNVEPPFGVESLQLISSNREFKSLPEHYYDRESGYYMIGKSPKDGLQKTRGLIRKQSKKREISEAVLLFTTMQK
ncbi:MAG: hypothetical protein U9R50_02070, partial [Campylobacterota bacterium]|nr:hypothetical protein [Campylobacterota bacterium]